jgi:hypothetical protein
VPPTAVASLHLWRYRLDAAPVEFARIVRAAAALRRRDDVRFARALVTAGFWTVPVPNPSFSRFGLFAVWRDEAALDAFAHSAPAARLARRGTESWRVHLKPFRSVGSWGGSDPFDAGDGRPEPGMPVAILTHGTLKPRYVARFWWTQHGVARQLLAIEDGLWKIGLGDRPDAVSTFSIWRDYEHAARYAYDRATMHQPAMLRSRQEEWMSEEAFARFVPFASAGTWDGVDPLAELAPAATGQPAPATVS